MSVTKVKTLKPDAIVSIEVSGAFISLLNDVLIRMIDKLGDERAVYVMGDLKDSDGDLSLMDDDTKDLYAIMSIIEAAEEKFALQGKMGEDEITIDDTK